MSAADKALPAYSHVLWDFNGTILDDVSVGISSVNVLLARRGLHTLADAEEYRSYFTFPIIEYYRRLGFDFEAEPYSEVAVEWVEQYMRFVRDAKLCPGAAVAFELLCCAGIKQLVLSATELGMLSGQIETLGIGGYFDEILGMDTIEAHGKLPVALEWYARTKPRRAVLIGDTPHDAEVARRTGIDCVLVSCGHSDARTLASLGLPVFARPDEAVRFIIDGT